MTLDELVVKISADNKDILKKLDEVVKSLQKTKDAANKTSDSFEDMGKSAQSAAEKSDNQFSAALQKTMRQMISFQKIVKEVTGTIEEYTEQNPNSEWAQTVNEVKTAWQDVKYEFLQAIEPMLPEIKEIILIMLDGLHDVNQWIKLISQTLANSAIMDVINFLLTWPVQVSNWLLESVAKDIGITLNSVTVMGQRLKDLSKYQDLINKKTKDYKRLIGGFDELNIYTKKEDVDDSKKAIEELNAIILEDQAAIAKKQQEINETWEKHAKTLGISVDDFKELWALYMADDKTGFEKKLEELDVDLPRATRAMQQFESDGWIKIQTLQGQIDELKNHIADAKRMIGELGGKIDALPEEKTIEVKVNYGKSIDEAGAEEQKKTFWDTTLGRIGRTILGNFAGNLLGMPLTGAVLGGFGDQIFTGKGLYDTPTTSAVQQYNNTSSVTSAFGTTMKSAVTEANGELASVISQSASQVITAIGNQNLEVRIGDDVIAAAANRGNRLYYNRIGGALG